MYLHRNQIYQLTQKNVNFSSNYGVRFGSLFDPSWPRCSQRATKINTNAQTKVLGRRVVLLSSLPPKKAHFFFNYGLRFGPHFDPSWPRCSQRAALINTTTKKKLSFGRSYFYWISGTPSERRVCGLDTVFTGPIACRPGAWKSTFGNGSGWHLGSAGLLLGSFRLPWKLTRAF